MRSTSLPPMSSFRRVAAAVLALLGACGCSKGTVPVTPQSALEGGLADGSAGALNDSGADAAESAGAPDVTAPDAAQAELPFANLGHTEDVVRVWAGGNHVCWLLSAGVLNCTTENPANPDHQFTAEPCTLVPCNNQRLSVEGTFAVDLGAGGQIQQVVLGAAHACALLDGGRVKCWGAGGLLGLGDIETRGDQAGELGDALPFLDFGTAQPAVELAAGVHGDHTCARFADGSIRCWGSNAYGELGLGDSKSRGDEPLEMGSRLPTVNLGTGASVIAIKAGSGSTCALLDGGNIKCWGNNNFGQLGLGDGLRRGAQSGEMGDALPSVQLGAGRTAVELSAGGWHYCARLDNGSTKCWGCNTEGQLGLGDTQNRGDRPDQMGDMLPALDLGTGRQAVQLMSGGSHTCAVLNNTGLKCWGDNRHAQLGLGDLTSRGGAPNEMGDALPQVALGARQPTTVALGFDFTCALLGDSSLHCWGAWSVLPNFP